MLQQIYENTSFWENWTVTSDNTGWGVEVLFVGGVKKTKSGKYKKKKK